MSWTSVASAPAVQYTVVGVHGLETYDQADETYDASTDFYDGMNPNYWSSIVSASSPTWSSVASAV